jgi:hypothetical protein
VRRFCAEGRTGSESPLTYEITAVADIG